MKQHWSLLNLDIIGYVGVLESATLPRVLAPVFRDRTSPEIVVLPPFTLVVDEVFNAVPSTTAGLEDLIAKDKITLLPEPISGKVGHDLWVDEGGVVAYSSKVELKRAFEAIFKGNLDLAEKRLAEGDYKGAGEHAAIARAVKPSHLDPLVIRAAAERMAKQPDRFAFTRNIAKGYVSPDRFDYLVEIRTGGTPIAETRGAAVMSGAAARKPRLAAAAQ